MATAYRWGGKLYMLLMYNYVLKIIKIDYFLPSYSKNKQVAIFETQNVIRDVPLLFSTFKTIFWSLRKNRD